MIRLSLIGVRVEVPTNQPIVLLREESGARFLPIFIGSPEATAIVYALQGMETPRPMTHDLFKTVLDDMSVKLEKVEIEWITMWIGVDNQHVRLPAHCGPQLKLYRHGSVFHKITKVTAVQSFVYFVDPTGFEPVTSTLQMWRSTN